MSNTNNGTISSNALLEQLSAEFPKKEVKQRDGGFGKKLDYISIDSTINRLLGVVGLEYSFVHGSTDLRVLNDGSYLAVVSGNLVVGEHSHYGVGADIDRKDPDKAVKTALAEAIKKAGHQLGIGLYLWSEAKRDEIENYRILRESSVAALQRAVAAKLSKSELDQISKEKLRDKEELLKLLEA